MSRFLESIALRDQRAALLPWHQRRVDRTLAHFYPGVSIDLNRVIDWRQARGERITRVRICYDREVTDVQYSSYEARTIETLRLWPGELDYAFKYLDRRLIEHAFAQRGECDDVLFVKGGRITDSSIANVVFSRDGKWYTPREPLLPGTMRQYLIDHGLLTEAHITPADLPSFTSFKLINALVGVPEKEYPVANIRF